MKKALLTAITSVAMVVGTIGVMVTSANAGGYKEVVYEVTPEIRMEDGYETYTGDYRIVQVEDNGNLGAFDKAGLYTAYHIEDGYKMGDLVRTTVIYDHNSPYDDAIVAVISYVVERVE